LTIRLLTHTDLPDLLREGAPDAAIAHGRGEWPRLNAHFLFADRLIPMCSPAYLAAQRRLVEPAHLLTETLISTDDTAEDWAAWFAMVGLHGEQPQRMLHFANSVLPAHAAMNGLGFALIDPSLVTSELDLGRLIAPPVVSAIDAGDRLVSPAFARSSQGSRDDGCSELAAT